MAKRDGVFQRPGKPGYYISYQDVNGKRRKVRTNARTRTEAKQMRAAYLTRVEQAKILGVTPPSNDLFEVVTKRFLDYQRAHTSFKHYERCEGIVRLHLMPRYEGRVFADVTLAELEQYVIDRSREVGAHSIEKEVNTIKRMWALAVGCPRC